LTRCGWLELQAGRIEPACESWKKSLELAPDQFAQILRVARPSIDLTRHIGRLVPDSPEWILDVAIEHFAAETDRPIRRTLLSKAEYLLQDIAVFDARANWLLGRISLLREDGRRAVSYLTRALMLRPEETAWRYELALALKQAGRYLEAQQQAQVCAGMEPENARYKALLREVNQARVARKRDS
jgi:tetratricopeptide (TPR) repeat protein